jgi:hypothetical protein
MIAVRTNAGWRGNADVRAAMRLLPAHELAMLERETPVGWRVRLVDDDGDLATSIEPPDETSVDREIAAMLDLAI